MDVSSLSLLTSSSLLYDSNILNDTVDKNVGSELSFLYILGFSGILLTCAAVKSLFGKFDIEHLIFLTYANLIDGVDVSITTSNKKTQPNVAENNNWFERFLEDSPSAHKEEIEDSIKTKMEAGWYFVSNFDSVLAFNEWSENGHTITQELADLNLNPATNIKFFFIATIKLSEHFQSNLASWMNPLLMYSSKTARELVNLFSKPVLIMYDHVSRGYNIIFFQTVVEANTLFSDSQTRRILISASTSIKSGVPQNWYVSGEFLHSMVLKKNIIFSRGGLDYFNEFRNATNTLEVFYKLNNDIEFSQKIAEKVEKYDQYRKNVRIIVYKGLRFAIYKSANTMFTQVI